MLVNGKDTNEPIKANARNRLAELSKPKDDLVFYVDGTISRNGVPISDDLIESELTEEQKNWVRFRLTHPNTWPKVHDKKIGDHKNWQ